MNLARRLGVDLQLFDAQAHGKEGAQGTADDHFQQQKIWPEQRHDRALEPRLFGIGGQRDRDQRD